MKATEEKYPVISSKNPSSMTESQINSEIKKLIESIKIKKRD